ncbi:hypothetical protein [Thaumasiovibrio sp. DFM-14]|uniref:hypothetical protein n=1 Tax=Thaumasiovibrio sp. DFM-14 TaxID=3384792 RepID=UPI00399F2AA3
MSLTTGHWNTLGNATFLKAQFTRNLAAGEKLIGSEFELSFDEYPELTVMVRSAQMPQMARHNVEDFGAMGLGFEQHGTLENKGEITVSCVETIQGDVYKALREMVKDKKYVTVTMRATPESQAGISPAALKFKLQHCKIRVDATDFSTEDTTALVKPSITITYNWVDL